MFFKLYIIFMTVLICSQIITPYIRKKKLYKMIKNIEDYKESLKEFKYNGKKLVLKTITDTLTPKYFDYSYNKIKSHTLFINDIPVVSVWELDTLSNSIRIIYNKSYNTDDLYKVLKTYTNECKKASMKKLKDSLHEEKQNIW